MNKTLDNILPMETIDERDLHAYVDGFLDDQRARQFEDYLKRHPELRAQVEDYLQQNRLLREAFEPQGNDPVPLRLLSVLNRPVKNIWPNVGKIAAVFVLCVVSAGGGWWGAHQNAVMMSEEDGMVGQFLHQVALNSKKPFEAMSVQKLEINADNQADPLNWLTQKVALEMQAPNLAEEGYSIQWRRLVTRESQEFVELTYANVAGDTIKLYMKTRWQKEAPTLEFVQKVDQSIAYWQDGPLVYALSGSFDRDRATKLADLIRTSMGRGPAAGPMPSEDLQIRPPQTLQSVQQPQMNPSLVPDSSVDQLNSQNINATGGS